MLMLSEDSPNCSFFHFFWDWMAEAVVNTSCFCSCSQAVLPSPPDKPRSCLIREICISLLCYTILCCVAAQREALSPHRRQGNNQLLKVERKGITWWNAMLLECFCSGVCRHRWSRALSPVTLFALPHQLHFSKFLTPTAAPDLPFSAVLQLASTHLWKGSLEQII